MKLIQCFEILVFEVCLQPALITIVTLSLLTYCCFALVSKLNFLILLHKKGNLPR